jgi:hypothetical protein
MFELVATELEAELERAAAELVAELGEVSARERAEVAAWAAADLAELNAVSAELGETIPERDLADLLHEVELESIEPAGAAGRTSTADPMESAEAMRLSQLSSALPGPALAEVLEAVQLGALAGFELVEVMIAAHRQVAHSQARLLDVLAEFAGRRPGLLGVASATGRARQQARVSEFAAEEVAAAFGVSRVAAGWQLAHALTLTEDLPSTLAALRAGRIDATKAHVIAEETAVLATDPTASVEPGAVAARAAVEAQVLGRAGAQTPGALRTACRRAVLAADRGAAERRHKAARAERKVVVYPLPDGIAELRWTDTVDRVLGLSTALDGLARAARAADDETARAAKHEAERAGPTGAERAGRAGGDGAAEQTERRSMDQLRADALAELGARLLADPRLPETQGARPHIGVVVPLGLLFGSRGRTDETGDLSQPDQPGQLGQRGDPAELVGYGPIPDSLARMLAAEGIWTRWLTEPVGGQLLDVGRSRYRPTAAIREFVLARDRTCQGPEGCRVSARRCDLDHTVDWAHGGATSTTGTAALCRRTHRAKHDGGWTVVRDGPALRWTAPTGHQYERSPDPLPGAAARRPLTGEQFQQVRDHARQLGFDPDLITGAGPPEEATRSAPSTRSGSALRPDDASDAGNALRPDHHEQTDRRIKPPPPESIVDIPPF